jgi:hypothetical protein
MCTPESLSRREFAALALAAGGWLAQGAAAEFPRLEAVVPAGVLIRECPLRGERRADEVVPAHPSGLQVSRDRWLLVYATRGFRGVDDDRSIVWQLRAGGPEGRVLKDGMFARSIDDWDPLGKGEAVVRQHGHPVAFGVPRGALLAGRPAPHGNVFVALWRVVGRRLDRERKLLLHGSADAELTRRTQGVEWVQFRLNDREDDLEVLQPAAALRQKGYDKGPAFCSASGVVHMNQAFAPPVAFNADTTAWVGCNHFDGGRLAALKFVFNPTTRRYEWTETGPLFRGPDVGLVEASVARAGQRWAIAARLESGKGVGWLDTADPFGRLPAVSVARTPAVGAPLTLFRCADGVLRLFSGDAAVSPQRNARDPLYLWDIDPRKDFAATGQRVVFDSIEAKLALRPAAAPKIDMCKLLPPVGRTQLAVFRVSVRSYNHPYTGGSGKPAGIPPINADEKAACAIYAARLRYSAALPGAWTFTPG